MKDKLEERLFKANAVNVAIVLAYCRSAIAMGGAPVVSPRVNRIRGAAGAAHEQAAKQILRSLAP